MAQEELSTLDTEELFSIYLETGDESLKDYADDLLWNLLEDEHREEEKALHNLENERQDG